MHVFFDCDNYDTLRQDTLKKIKAIDSIELDTDSKIQNSNLFYRMDL